METTNVTIEFLKNSVEAFKAMTATVKNAYPANATAVSWEIKDIPYLIWKEFKDLYSPNERDNESNKKLFYFYADGFRDGCQIALWSTPVNLRTTYEVIEETDGTGND